MRVRSPKTDNLKSSRTAKMLEFLATRGHEITRSGAVGAASLTSNQTIAEGSIMADGAICAADECCNRSIARGLCEKHYRRWKKRGTLETVKTPAGTAERFIRDVALSHSGESCLTWPLAVDKDGYARGRVSGTPTDRAHRVVCILAHGDPPSPAHEAAHSCGRGHLGCVSPRHLSWKLPIANAADRIEHGTHLRGDRGSARKLSWADVDKIRGLKGTMSTEAIGVQFGVSQTNISMILRGKTWKEEYRQ